MYMDTYSRGVPNKTIYVSDDDLPLFARAQELVGGNLSGAIVAALRRFIDIEEGRLAGYDEVVLPVGPDGARKQRFVGRLLADWSRYTEAGVNERYRVYQGRSGKFVVHRQVADWSTWRMDESGDWLKDLTGLRNIRGMLGLGTPDWGDFTLEVVESADRLRTVLPDKLYRIVRDSLDNPQAEELDV
jgi:EXLDI family protein